MAKKKNEGLVKAESQDLSAFIDEGTERTGFENVTKDDIQIPLITLLQGISPICVNGEGRPGAWYHTVNEEQFDKEEGFLFVPSVTRHTFVEWTPREQGSRFQGFHEPGSDVVKRAIQNASAYGAYKTPEGNDLVDTFYVYGVICDEVEPVSMGVIPFKKTAIRPYRHWISRLMGFSVKIPDGRRVKPSIDAHLTRVTSTMKQNDQGQYFVPVLRSANPDGLLESMLRLDDPRRLAAREVGDMVTRGDATFDPNSEGSAEGTLDESSRMRAEDADAFS